MALAALELQWEVAVHVRMELLMERRVKLLIFCGGPRHQDKGISAKGGVGGGGGEVDIINLNGGNFL